MDRRKWPWWRGGRYGEVGQHLYCAEFMLTASHKDNIIETKYTKKPETNFNGIERERFVTFAISIVDALCTLHAEV